MSLNREERRILKMLKDEVPHLAGPFVSCVTKGRSTILHRLAVALFQEDISGLISNSYDLTTKGSAHKINSPTTSQYKKIVRTLREFGIQDATCKVVPLFNRESLVVPIAGSYAFGRFDVKEPILQVCSSNARPLRHAVELLELIRKKETLANGRTAKRWADFAKELSNSSANLALAYAYYEEKRKSLRKVARGHGAETTLELVKALQTRTEGYDASLFFEQLCIDGHNLHPGTKTKIGMDPADVYRYAPEFQGMADIRFVAIRKDYAKFTTVGEKDFNTLLFEEYPELQGAVAQQFRTTEKLSMADYALVPVHSWQLEQTIPVVYRNELSQKVIVPIETFSIPSSATTSFRTLIPQSRKAPAKFAVKTSVNSQMTSSIRSISINTTQNGPRLSEVIHKVLQREPELFATFVPVCEVAGASFRGYPAENSDLWNAKSRNLSALLREDVNAFVEGGELAIVGSSLYSESPLAKKPILIELIETYSDLISETSLPRAASRFVSEYAAISLPGFLTMMVKYGIGLEGHLQNSVPVFKQGRPVRMLFRDWGGVRIYTQRLEQQGLVARLDPGSITIAGNVEEMRNKVFYTVFQNHLSEIVFQACKHLAIREQELWKEIYHISEGVFERLMSDPEQAKNVAADRKALYGPEMSHKALTKMRLDEREGDCYVAVPNPLHRFSRLRVTEKERSHDTLEL